MSKYRFDDKTICFRYIAIILGLVRFVEKMTIEELAEKTKISSEYLSKAEQADEAFPLTRAQLDRILQLSVFSSKGIYSLDALYSIYSPDSFERNECGVLEMMWGGEYLSPVNDVELSAGEVFHLRVSCGLDAMLNRYYFS